MPAPLAIPDLEWRDGCAWSREHGDPYASRAGARAEREHVFLRGNGFGAAGDADAGRWAGAARTTWGELGFGAGITFTCAWAAFRRHAPSDAQLDWVSTEHAPLDPGDLVRAALADPAMAGLEPSVRALAAVLPPRVPGIHRRVLDGGRVRLTILLGDVLDHLGDVPFIADAWCLDGFAPARNPRMWSTEALALVAAHAGAGTTLATYAAASAVGDRLAGAGFRVQRRDGALGKREMIVADLAPDGATVGTRGAGSGLRPWFRVPPPVGGARRGVVIGAGLAGAAAARALAERGMRVDVVDARGPATGASAAPRAVLAPHLASWQSPQARVVAQAFLLARATMERIGAPMEPCGLLHPMPTDEDMAHRAALAEWGWPAGSLEVVDAAIAARIAGTPVGRTEEPMPAVHVPWAAVTRPAETVRAALAHAGIEVHGHAPVARLERRDGHWLTVIEDGRSIEADVVVLATAGIPAGAIPGMPEPLAADAMPSVPMDATRGQLSILEFPACPAVPQAVVSANGFVMPPDAGAICCGATFERERLDAPAAPRDDAMNLGHAERLVPALAGDPPVRRGAWAGVRTSVHDHCPVIGPVPADLAFRQAFARLAHGPLADAWPDAPVVPGLFATLAHGSRGTATAFLAAELIADMVSGSPRCVGDGLLAAVLPQRFLVRELRAARGSLRE